MENMKDKELMIFQMGPVQEFIAQAANPADLWAGSYLLSSLIKAGLDALVKMEGMTKEDVVFPNLTDGTIEAALAVGIPTLPNRFLAFVPRGKGKVCGDAVKAAIRAKLGEYADETIARFDLEEKRDAFRTQVDCFLQMTWAVLPEPSGQMGKDYKAIGEKLAARRNVREFAAWCERDSGRDHKKDFLTGKETALCDGRGAMNLIKQMMGEKQRQNAVDDEPYLAVIAMDGDKMGKKLSDFKDANEHRAFSTKLAAFAIATKEKMEKDYPDGQLIYAGGDDVLAVVPATRAILCAKELRDLFGRMVDGLAASAGIAVGHRKTPLQDVVIAAQAAEHRAKHVYKRDAVALSVFKRSGEILEWGCDWDSNGLNVFKLLREIVNQDSDKNDGIAKGKLLSGRFPYKLAALLEPYGFKNGKQDEANLKEMQGVINEEFDFALERSLLANAEKDDAKIKIKKLKEYARCYLETLFASRVKDGETLDPRPADFLTVFLCETFIDRPRNANGEE